VEFPEDLRYTEEHEWIRVSDGRATVGITEYAQDQLGDVVYVELPSVGDEVKAMRPFGVVESVKAASDLFSPLTGIVVEVNSKLAEEPELVNNDPYGDGWMIVVELEEGCDLSILLDPEEYAESLPG